MTTPVPIILHHFDPSPFSEKVRIVFGYEKTAWHSVQIPRILPRPDTSPLPAARAGLATSSSISHVQILWGKQRRGYILYAQVNRAMEPPPCASQSSASRMT